MPRKTQVLFIHGGMTFKNDKDYLKHLRTKRISLEAKHYWNGSYLEKSLGSKFEVIRPRMPLADNAKYRHWKIFFERYLKFLSGKYILVGYSLGGVFLAKYLTENKLRRKPFAVFMVAPPFDSNLPKERLEGGFKLGPNLSSIYNNASNLNLLFSQDDKVVPISHAEKYKKKLPEANFVIFKKKGGHFIIPKFPELIKLIKNAK